MTWNGCFIALPWFFYRYYGNPIAVKRYYGALKKLQLSYLSQCGDSVPSNTFGDWCAPNAYGNYRTSFSSVKETEYHMKFLTSRMMSDMARVIGKADDADFFDSAAQTAAQQYIQCFYNKNSGMFSGGKQAPNFYALADGFLSEKEQKRVADRLTESIIRNGKHLELGIFGIGYMIEEMGKLGAVDTALECFMNPEYPSFAEQIAKGATTLWEQWCGTGDMSSHNHAMFAGAVSGFYTTVAGITPIDNGFRAFKIKPVISKYINKLDFAFETVNGRLEMHYSIKDGNFSLKLLIPGNCRADVILPNGEKTSVGNGKYAFNCNISNK